MKRLYSVLLILSFFLGSLQAADLSKGYSFTSNDNVTNVKLNNLVDEASISNIDQADIKDLRGLVYTSGSAPSDTDAVWRDSSNSYALKVYNGSSWVSLLSGGAANDVSFSSGFARYIEGCFVYRHSSTQIGVTAGTAMINGEFRRNTSATTTTYTVPDAGDYIDVYAVADASDSTFTVELVDSGTSPGGSTPTGTNTRLLGSMVYAGSSYTLVKPINVRKDSICGWWYVQGDDTSQIDGSIPFPVTFSGDVSSVNVSSLGRVSTGTTPAITAFTAGPGEVNSSDGYSITTSSMTISSQFPDANTFSSSFNFYFGFEIKGRIS